MRSAVECHLQCLRNPPLRGSVTSVDWRTSAWTATFAERLNLFLEAALTESSCRFLDGYAIVLRRKLRRIAGSFKEDVMELWQLGLYAAASLLALKSLTMLMSDHRNRIRRDAAIQARLKVMAEEAEQDASESSPQQQSAAKAG